MILALPFMSCMTMGKSLTTCGPWLFQLLKQRVMVKIMDFGNGLLGLNSITNITLGKLLKFFVPQFLPL